MSAVLVDSNVLLDVLTEHARWFAWSAEALEEQAEHHLLAINPIIYAEVSIRFERIEELEECCLFHGPPTMGGRVPGGEVFYPVSTSGWVLSLSVA